MGTEGEEGEGWGVMEGKGLQVHIGVARCGLLGMVCELNRISPRR